MLSADDLSFSLVAGAELSGTLPSGLQVRIRALSPGERDQARRRAGRVVQVDPAFGQIVARIVADQAERLAQSSPEAPQGSEAEARVLYRLSKSDPEAWQAYEDLKAWNAAVTIEIAAAGLVSCEALKLAAGATADDVVARLRSIRRPEVQSLVTGEIYTAVKRWSEGAELGKALSGPPSGSTSDSGGPSGEPAVQIAMASSSSSEGGAPEH